ncbi:MAG: hypothetical protein MZV70_29800 [Desulfobacterales bacterium]|nr:hypothetical protein [Desulfobacterales bacterium]
MKSFRLQKLSRSPQADAKRRRSRGFIKGIVIAGTHSGCGKTTVSLGSDGGPGAARPEGGAVQGGSRLHRPRATMPAGRADGQAATWTAGCCRAPYNLRSLSEIAASTADIAVVEGVMGLFDGYDGKTEAGSTAQMAKWLGLPVLLVVDARSMARSAAALVQGFENFDPAAALRRRDVQPSGQPAAPGLRCRRPSKAPCACPAWAGCCARRPIRHTGTAPGPGHPRGAPLDDAAMSAGWPTASRRAWTVERVARWAARN